MHPRRVDEALEDVWRKGAMKAPLRRGEAALRRVMLVRRLPRADSAITAGPEHERGSGMRTLCQPRHNPRKRGNFLAPTKSPTSQPHLLSAYRRFGGIT